MPVIEQQPFHFFIVQQFFAPLPDYRQIIFMNYFIALQIKKPVALAGIFCNIGLVGIFCSIWKLIEVPGGMNDLYFIRLYLLYFLQCVIIRIAVAKRYYKFIYNWQNRFNRL